MQRSSSKEKTLKLAWEFKYNAYLYSMKHTMSSNSTMLKKTKKEQSIKNQRTNNTQNINRLNVISRVNQKPLEYKLTNADNPKNKKINSSPYFMTQKRKIPSQKNTSIKGQATTKQKFFVGQKQKNPQRATQKSIPNLKPQIEQTQEVIGMVTIKKGSVKKVKEYLTRRKTYLLSKDNWYIFKDKFLNDPMDWEFLVPCIKQAQCQALNVYGEQGNPLLNVQTLFCLPIYSRLKTLTINLCRIFTIEFFPFMSLDSLQDIQIDYVGAHIYKPLNKTNWPNLKYFDLKTAYPSDLMINRMRMNPNMQTVRVTVLTMRDDDLLCFRKSQIKTIKQFEVTMKDPIIRLHREIDE